MLLIFLFFLFYYRKKKKGELPKFNRASIPRRDDWSTHMKDVGRFVPWHRYGRKSPSVFWKRQGSPMASRTPLAKSREYRWKILEEGEHTELWHRFQCFCWHSWSQYLTNLHLLHVLATFSDRRSGQG